MATMTKEEVEQLLAERDAKNDLKIQKSPGGEGRGVENSAFLGPDPQEEAVG